jgi:hypothetical protein
MRIVRSALSLILISGMTVPSSTAQELPVEPGIRVQLNELKESLGGMRCGTYFFSHPSLTQFGKTSITFNFIIPPEKEKIGVINIMDRVDLDKFRIVEDPSATVPTFMIIKGRTTNPTFEIMISPKELRKSRCLISGIAA